MSLLDGGIAGSFSATATCPIEVVKTHLHASRYGSEMALVARYSIDMTQNIMGVKAVRGSSRGILRTLIGIFSARGTYLWVYATTKSTFSERYGDDSALLYRVSSEGEHFSNIKKTLPD